jgi:hypothetical protein
VPQMRSRKDDQMPTFHTTSALEKIIFKKGPAGDILNLCVLQFVQVTHSLVT